MPRGGSADLRVIGQNATPMVDRIIAEVTTDWDPPNPNTDPWITVSGETLADVEIALKANDEWGKGGGQLRSERISVGTSTDLSISLHGNLEMRVAVWKNYSKASAAAKKEWNRMIGKLTAHEQRHMDIAIEEFNKVATSLVGKDIGKISHAVTTTNAKVKKRQKKMDKETDHGEKKDVQYGDVSLNRSIV